MSKRNTAVIQECYDLVNQFFEGNARKTWLWFQIKNPLLGSVSPLDMIKVGREKKLLAFIQGQLEGNHP